MKLKTKVAMLAVGAVALVSASIAGTVAYLTDRESVVNTFTIGNAAIILDEAAVDQYGDPIAGEDRTRIGNEYHLVPGETYVKDPRITITAGSEAVYVRMLVTINKIEALNQMSGGEFLPENYVGATWDANVWKCVDIVDNGDDTKTYEFRYYDVGNQSYIVNAANAADDLVLEPLFEEFTVPGSVTSDQIQTLQDLQITVVGHAVQATGFGDPANDPEAAVDEAWSAFDQQHSNT